MRTRFVHAGRAPATGTTALCVVLLPGAQQSLEDFERAGFGQALLERGSEAQLILAAPALAHVTDRAWIARLHDEVIAPTRAHTGGALWLGGVSLGAYMALRYAAEHDEAIDGLCLLAPYLGSRIVAAEVAAHERIEDWQPGELAQDDDERRIWQYLRRIGGAVGAPEVFVGYGADDRFADTQRLLAALLPRSSPRVLPGGHEWPVWRQLWENFLDLHDAARSQRRPTDGCTS